MVKRNAQMASDQIQKPQETDAASAESAPSVVAGSVIQVSSSTSGAEVPSSGRRQAFAQIKRELNETEVTNPGVVKLLLELLQSSDADCEILRGYQERFHEADKRASILEEKLRSNNAIEIGFAIGVTVGGIAVGLAPAFWNPGPSGALFLALGAALIIGSTVMRVVKG